MWERHVLPVLDPRYATGETNGTAAAGQVPSSVDPAAGSARAASSTSAEAATAAVAALGSTGGADSEGAAAAAAPAPVNPLLLKWGLSPQVARDAVNPGFAGPHPCCVRWMAELFFVACLGRISLQPLCRPAPNACLPCCVTHSQTPLTHPPPPLTTQTTRYCYDWLAGWCHCTESLFLGTWACPDLSPACHLASLPTRAQWFGLSLMRGKLDWTLLRCLAVVGKDIGNHDCECSPAADTALRAGVDPLAPVAWLASALDVCVPLCTPHACRRRAVRSQVAGGDGEGGGSSSSSSKRRRRR